MLLLAGLCAYWQLRIPSVVRHSCSTTWCPPYIIHIDMLLQASWLNLILAIVAEGLRSKFFTATQISYYQVGTRNSTPLTRDWLLNLGNLIVCTQCSSAWGWVYTSSVQNASLAVGVATTWLVKIHRSRKEAMKQLHDKRCTKLQQIFGSSEGGTCLHGMVHVRRRHYVWTQCTETLSHEAVSVPEKWTMWDSCRGSEGGEGNRFQFLVWSGS